MDGKALSRNGSTTETELEMPTEIAKTAENQVPTSPFSVPLLANFRRAMGWVNGKPMLMGGFRISPDQRRQIEASISSFRRQLSVGPNDRQAIGLELAKLLTAFPIQSQDGLSADMRIDAYVDAIGIAPAWAVREARLKVVRGEVPELNKNFAPTPPAFADIVKAVLRPFRADLADLEALGQIESAHEPTPEEQERVAKAVEDLRAELHVTIDKAEAERSARVRAHVDKANETLFERECAAAGMDPKSAVSPSLLKSLGVPTTATVKGDTHSPVVIDREAIAECADALEKPIGDFDKPRRTA